MTTCNKCQTSLPASAAFCPECGAAPDGEAVATEGRPRPEEGLESASGLQTLGGMQTIGSADTRGGHQAAPTLEPGTSFAGRYEILGVLGAGGMGVVYRALDDVSKREVALKLIRPGRTTSQTEIDRLISEGVTARDIRHDAVVAVYDVGADAGQPYLSMEVVEGTSLRDWMRERLAQGEDVPVGVAVSIVRTIGEGLRAAHGRGVIHRDLKPENVILTSEPTVDGAALKILDFGIARVHDAASGSGSGSGAGGGAMNLGTPRYMAPEQVTSPEVAGPSADVYSLSVLLYELLVGVLPQGHWQPPSGGRRDVSRGLDELVHSGLSNRPASRPQTMEHFLYLLFESKGTQAKRSDVGGQAAKSLEDAGRRIEDGFSKAIEGVDRRVWAWVGGGLALLLVLVTWAAMSGGGDPEFDPGYDFDDGGQEQPFEPGPGPDVPPATDDPRQLTGTWTDGVGTSFDVTVRSNGRFSGKGSLDDGTPASIRGTVNDGIMNAKIRAMGSYYATLDGFWDGMGSFMVQMEAAGGGIGGGQVFVHPSGQ